MGCIWAKPSRANSSASRRHRIVRVPADFGAYSVHSNANYGATHHGTPIEVGAENGVYELQQNFGTRSGVVVTVIEMQDT